MINSLKFIHYYCEDGENFSFLEQFRKFDIIHLRNTFHHFYKPKEFIQNSLKLLKKDGKLIIVDIDYESFFYGIGRFSIGEMCTWVTIIKTIGIKKTIKAIIKNAFWSNIYRKHHFHDIILQKSIGWFKSTEILTNLRKTVTDLKYGRIGGCFSKGGVYYALYIKRGDE